MGLKRYFSLIILLALVCCIPAKTIAQKVQRVVIDAGHGGHDPGAAGKHSHEKDVALAIALKTGAYIQNNLKDVEVIYTRKTDVFVELFRRAKIANEAKADLFISIHCNANKSATPYGSETYVMGLHRSEANLAVAQLENASILLEDDYHVKYDGFDPTSPEGYIFFSMLQNAFLDQSLQLATFVQKQFHESVNMYDRGVKQAGFLVLYKTTMPSVLIETGFISNASDEKILTSTDGQDKLARAIYRAVKNYKAAVEKTTLNNDTDTESVVIADSNPNLQNPNQDQNQSITSESAATVDENQSAANSGNPDFRVQFLISKTRLSPNAPELKGLSDVEWYRHSGMYKYTYGHEKNPELALKLVKQLKDKGFSDAFVVAFLNGERIAIDEARKLLKN